MLIAHPFLSCGALGRESWVVVSARPVWGYLRFEVLGFRVYCSLPTIYMPPVPRHEMPSRNSPCWGIAFSSRRLFRMSEELGSLMSLQPQSLQVGAHVCMRTYCCLVLISIGFQNLCERASSQRECLHLTLLPDLWS